MGLPPNLSLLEQPLRDGLSAQGGLQQLINHLVQPDAVVATVAVFDQVKQQMPAADGMASAMQTVLHVADHGIEPLEHHLVVIPTVLVDDDRFVPALVVGDGGWGSNSSRRRPLGSPPGSRIFSCF